MAANIKSGSIDGHKEMSIEEKERRNAKSMTENGDVEDLVKNRVLSNASITRAALYDKDDVQQVAGSVQRFDLSDEQVRTLLDALLAAQREIEGGETTVNSAKPPKSVEVEGTSYSFADKSLATAVLTASGKPDIYMVQSAKYFLLAEATENAPRDSVKVIMDSFGEGLQSQNM